MMMRDKALAMNQIVSLKGSLSSSAMEGNHFWYG